LKPVIAKEVKEDILAKVKAGEKISSLAQQYGVSNRTVYTWLQRKAEGVVSLLEYSKIKKENQILKEIIGVLTYELEKVKKRPELRQILKERIPQATKALIARLLGLCRSGLLQTS
jgi:transposase-like protein